MWSSFAVALVVGALFLYLPGYLVLRAVRASRIASVACAPVLGTAAYALVCVLYGKAGVACSWESVFLPLLALGLAAAAVSAAVERRACGRFRLADGDRIVLGGPDGRRDALLLCWYLAVGVVFTTFLFVKGLDGSGSFVQEIDNAHHLNAVRSFLDSGVWSSLSSSLYLASAPGVDPTPGVSFYPSAWHDVVALIADATGVTIAQGVNAANALFAGLVFPGCAFFLLRRLFKDRTVVLACGAIAAVSFAAFPWKILYWGPLYPNLASLCAFPAVAALFMDATDVGVRRSTRALAAAAFVAGVVALALLQPNAVFTTAVFLVPWCVHAVVRAVGRSGRFARSAGVWKALFAAGFVAFAVVVWAVLFNAPFLASVVSHNWPAFADGPQALVNIATLSFRETMAQVVLGIVVVVGAVLAFKDADVRWEAVSYVLACVIYFFCATTDDPVKYWLAGFWYTDSVRLAANAALFGIPLAALSLAFFVEKARAALAKREGGVLAAKPARVLPAALAAILCAFSVLNFYPSFTLAGVGEVKTAFGDTAEMMESSYSTTRVNVYSPSEREFVQEVVKTVPEGAVVINEPNDGSVFLYAVDGLETVYRRMRDYGGPGETDGSKLVRARLDEYATNDAVRAAVDEMGAEYVLQLDNPRYTEFPLGMQDVVIKPGRQRYENPPDAEVPDLSDYRKTGGQDTYYKYISYVPDEWEGVNSVDDETPGFEVVLSKGDMRLYRIVR